jgi:cell division protein FtsQ
MRRTLRAHPRALPLAALLAAVLAAGWFAVRDLSLFAVERVSVTGATGPDAATVRAALTDAARGMTTLHVDGDALEDAVARQPVVRAVEVDRDLPHGLTLHVVEHPVVAAVSVNGRRTPVTASGRVLDGARAAADLPEIGIGRHQATLVRLLAAAPAPLRRRARRAYLGDNGLTLAMREGPSLYFGRSDRLGAKWTAATTVLADAESAGATYVDVSVPERAAAGGVGGSTSGPESAVPTDPPAEVEVEG